jgi:uncharacterized protein (DUF2252 family)
MAGFVHNAIFAAGFARLDLPDCRLGNLGPVADARGRVKIAIRNLDQTVIGNPAHDLIRLGLSRATAIRGSDLALDRVSVRASTRLTRVLVLLP